MRIDIDLPSMLTHGCRRCRKPFTDADRVSVRYHPPKGRRPASGYIPLVEGAVLFGLSVYHEKCIPPVWWHRDQVAGSLPASDAPPESVPQQ